MKPQQIRVTKEFHFEMSHALWNYDGACKNIHGHSYKLFVTVIGHPIADATNAKLGMVIDFGDLKRIVHQTVVDKLDHCIVLNHTAPYQTLLQIPQMFDNHEILDYQPTCENLIIDISERIRPHLPPNLKLHSLRLYETAQSYAEWFASDNE